MERGKTYRDVAKSYIKNYLVSDRDPEFFSKLNDKLKRDEIEKITKDINIMKWIYGGNTDYQIVTSVTVYRAPDRSGIMFDNQPNATGNPGRKLSNILTILGAKEDLTPPADEDIEDVYKFYINTNYNPNPEQPKSSRFTSRASGLADFYKNFKR